MKRVRFLEPASTELENQIDYFDEQAEGLGDNFEQEDAEEENQKTVDDRKGNTMPRMKATKRRIKLDRLKTRTLTDQEQEKVKGGKTPSPAGPVPIPYPNLSK